MKAPSPGEHHLEIPLRDAEGEGCGATPQEDLGGRHQRGGDLLHAHPLGGLVDLLLQVNIDGAASALAVGVDG